ncbi:MAG TPA: LPS assembly lipoprotein LptE [Alphaproteobacteria bacterium]|jgi:LPS-assembly lipoprotein|nr:LPS assembly lipoprotein LptE [Alphaproteobacteria bacterium]
MKLLAAALFALTLAVAGCGYHPLYGTQARSASTTELGSVYVGPIANRDGQILRNFLIEQLNENEQPGNPTHTLTVNLQIQSTGIALSRDNTTSRTSITAVAAFTLVAAATNKPVLNSRARATTSYDVLQSDYATLVSREDAVNRTLREVSDEMRTRLAVYFSDRKTRGPATAARTSNP